MGRSISAVRGVIFDMDGVLVDSQPMHFEAEMATVAHFGYPISEGELKGYLGWKEDEFWADVIRRHSLKCTIEDMKAYDHPLIMRLLRERTGPDAVLDRALGRLGRMGLALAVASSAPRSFIDIVLDGLRARGRFSAVVSGQDTPKGKPDPSIFLLAASRLDLEPESCLVIEDAPSGIEAARRAGMKCIALLGAVNKDLDLSQADDIITSLSALPEHPLLKSR